MHMSLPVRGAWIEIYLKGLTCATLGRSPCGERGLKCLVGVLALRTDARRSPCGERGLKCPENGGRPDEPCRSPCGERGLKFLRLVLLDEIVHQSLPVRGAWIEISTRRAGASRRRSLPVRGAWIEIDKYVK